MMMMEFSVFPVGSGESLGAAVAQAVAIVRSSGLRHEVTDMGTIVEGSPGECLRLVESCLETLAKTHRRLSCSVKIDYRTGGESRLGKKRRSVLDRIEKGPGKKKVDQNEGASAESRPARRVPRSAPGATDQSVLEVRCGRERGRKPRGDRPMRPQ